MCSIAGYFCWNSSNDLQGLKKRLQIANKRMSSRGPDATAYLFDEEHLLGLGHNRLAIQDLSPDGNQPFLSNNKRFALVFNGQIYNHQELRDELLSLGHYFRTHCDTEVLMLAFEEWGTDSLHKLRGMFAFAVYDFAEKKLVLVRDRVGIKPLYFALQDGTVLFTSQLDALKILYGKEINHSQLSHYHFLHLLAVPAPLTIYEQLYKLPAGFLLEINQFGKVEIKQWYQPLAHINRKSIPTSFNAARDELGFLLEESIKLHTTSSDVPVAIFLSGGVDSSIITQFASKYSQITALHLRVFGEENSESIYARKLANQLNLPFYEIVIGEAEFLAALNQLVETVDDLVADPVCIPFLLLSKYAKQLGFKVVLIGEGADELFWGYDLYQKHKRLDLVGRYLWPIRALPQKLQAIFFKRFHSYQQEAVFRFIESGNSFEAGALGLFSNQILDLKNQVHISKYTEQIEMLCLFWGKNKQLDPFFFPSWHAKKQAPVYQTSDFWTTYLELQHRLPELLLMRCDKVAMSFGVETRVPFLDHKILEFALSLPLNLKTQARHPKAILKSLAELKLGTPDVWQKKIGFSTPLLKNWQPPAGNNFNNLSILQSWCLFLADKKK